MEKNTYIASKKGELFLREISNYFSYIKDSNIKKNTSENISLPISIFSNGLSGLEAITKYCKEVLGLRYCQIAKFLNRDDRTIWNAYNTSLDKSQEDYSKLQSNIHIPLEIFTDRVFSVLENLSVYLKEDLNLRYCKIASLLNKNDRTIWTVYNRVKIKRKNAA